MEVFTLISEDCYLFTWGNKAALVTKKQAILFAMDLFLNGLIALGQFPK